MFIVYFLKNQKGNNIQIGFTQNLTETHKYLNQKFKTKFTLLSQEKYKSIKDAMIRVKQLRNKIK